MVDIMDILRPQSKSPAAFIPKSSGSSGNKTKPVSGANVANVTPSIKETPKAPEEPKFFTNEAGVITGFVDPKTGRTFLGNISPEEKAAIQEKRRIITDEGTLAEQEQVAKWGRAEEAVKQQAISQGVYPQQAEVQQPQMSMEAAMADAAARGLYSGSVSPVTPDDLFSLASLGSGSLAALGSGIVVKSSLRSLGTTVLKKAVTLTRGKLGYIAGVVGAGFVGAIAKDILEGGAGEKQSVINTYGQLPSDIVEEAQKSIITLDTANRELNFLEDDLLRLENELHNKWLLSPKKLYLNLTGKIDDVNGDIADALDKIRKARGELILLQIEDPDALEMGYFIQNMMNKYGIKEYTIQEKIEELQGKKSEETEETNNLKSLGSAFLKLDSLK